MNVRGAMHSRIALFGNFGAGNLGNECTLQAMLLNLRRLLPAAEIICICSGPTEIAPAYNICAHPISAPVSVRPTLKMWVSRDRPLRRLARRVMRFGVGPYRWYKAFRVVKGCQVLLMTGTGMLGDFGIRPFGLHWYILGWTILARFTGCKVGFVSVGVGPVRNFLSRCFVKTSLALADYRSYRDSFSKRYLMDIGFGPSEDNVCPDLVFSLPEAILPAPTVNGGARRFVVGVGIMNYFDRCARGPADTPVYRRYVERLAKLVSQLLNLNYDVRLLIGDVRYDAGVRQDLMTTLQHEGQLREGKLMMDSPAASVEELLQQLVKTDCIIASRFHNVVLALMLNKPVIGLSYHEKFRPLMDGVGLGEFCHDIEKFEIDTIIAQVVVAQERGVELRRRIATATRIYREALDDEYTRVLDVCLAGYAEAGAVRASVI